VKVLKTANGKQTIKISQKELESMGKMANWVKIANDKYESVAKIILDEKIPFEIYDKEGNIIVPKNTKINKTMLTNLVSTYPNIKMPENPITKMIEKRLK
jgi:hypothetical protein